MPILFRLPVKMWLQPFELINPLGVSIFSYVQTWSGFANPQQNNTLDNDQSNARQVLIQVPGQNPEIG